MIQRLYPAIIIVLLAIPALAADKLTIAIVNFEANDIPKIEAQKITELVRNEMVISNQYIVIERAQVDKILREQGFQMSGCTDVSCAVQVGRLLSARKILVGTVMRLGEQIVITVRIVDVERGVADFSEKEVAKSSEFTTLAVERFCERLTQRITGKRVTPREGTVANTKKRSADVVYVYDAASNYRGVHDPTLWLGVSSLVGSAVTFAAGAGWYNRQKSDYEFSGGSFKADVLLMLGQPTLSWYVTNQHKKTMANNLATRNNTFIGAGSVGGLGLIMFITFGIRQARGSQSAMGEIYKNGAISLIIPPQYYSFSNLLKRKYPGLGLGVNYQF